MKYCKLHLVYTLTVIVYIELLLQYFIYQDVLHNSFELKSNNHRINTNDFEQNLELKINDDNILSYSIIQY